ncbi:MAG TPA: NADPH:quinone reductase [Pyrinomonadaceae bacterium]|nr:NADPH:quinone reductase [Pyrinomonadaceae bacterium]HMP66444.1 NADPH:quinone reductase [Pyrinomonadaceae bacterium]
MKAILVREFGGPDVMELADIERPVPGPEEVLVRVRAAGVNPVDTYIRSGIHAVKPELPYTPGKDGAGEVEAVGEDVTAHRPGDRVYIADTLTGTYAEYALCREDQLGILPDNVGYDEGAGVFTPYATAYRALFQKAGGASGETVLVHGASGGVGIAAVQWAKNAGLKVIGTASSEEGRKLISDNGADAAIDHSDPDHFAEIVEQTSGKGVDIILEMLANVNLERDFEALAKFGRIVVIGSRGSLEFTPRLTMTKDATIYGMSLFNATKSDMEQIHAAIQDGLADGFLRPYVSRKYPLAKADHAHREVIEGRSLGKIVLTL